MKIQEEFYTDYEDEIDRIRARQGRKKKHQKNARRRSTKKSAARRHSAKKKSGRLLLLVLIVLLLAGTWLFRRVQQDNGFWTISVFGLDSRDGKTGKGALADVQMLVSINKQTGEIRLASVFRDTYLQIDSDGDYNKINEAYFLGGYEQAVTALQDNFDIEIDDCVTFNWKAVADAINVLGGIDLEITDSEFAYINSFITETVESTGVASAHLTQSGMNHLDGVQAVAYARLRLMDTDFKRTERQRKVIGLAMEKVKQANFKTLKTLVGLVYPEIFTTIHVDDILTLVKNAKKYYISQTSGFPFSHTEIKISKKSCVVPATLESNVIQLHTFLYDDTGYTPSNLVKKISAHISKVSGVQEAGKDTESGKNIGAQDHIGNSQSAAASTQTSPAIFESAAETVSPEKENSEETSIAPTEESESEAENSDISSEMEDTNPENMGQGLGVSIPNRVSGPDTDDVTSVHEPGHAVSKDSVTGPGVEKQENSRTDGIPTMDAGSSRGNALEGPSGERTAPTESAVTGIRPGES